MFNTNYYFGLTRKYVTIFGTLFNDISITRPYTSNNVTSSQTLKVPLTYSSLDKLLARSLGDPLLDKKVAAVSPTMAFEITNQAFDRERNLQPTMQRRYTNSAGEVSSQFVGVPYNIDFDLYIYANQEEDGLRVLENILPYFTPALSVSSRLLPEMDHEIDIPIVLNSVNLDNRSYGALDERRQLIWTLSFTMKALFVGPITTGRKIIRIVLDNLYDMNVGNKLVETVRVQPGLTANGLPTTILDNSIDVTEINADDDFGYIVQIIPRELDE